MSTMEQTRKLDQSEIEKRFYDPTAQPSGDAKHSIQQVHQTFKAAANEIVSMLPPSREAALAVEHLEQAQMWAVKALATNSTSR